MSGRGSEKTHTSPPTSPQTTSLQQNSSRGGGGGVAATPSLLSMSGNPAASSSASSSFGLGRFGGYGGGDEQDDDDQAPFETVVLGYEAASSHLPSNLQGRFQDSVQPGAAQIAMLVEQWIATEGPQQTSQQQSQPPPPPQQQQQQQQSAATPGGTNSKTPSRRVSIQQHQTPPGSSSGSSSYSPAASSSSAAATNVPDQQQQQQQQQQNSPGGGAGGAKGKRGGTAGLSNAAKGRLRNLLEQGITDFTLRLQASILAETESVTIAAAQVVSRGGAIAHQLKNTQAELVIAKKEISRINDYVKEQSKRIVLLEEEANLRENQFDILRSQLTSREEMLRETTSTFRKELNRFRARISDLESENERKRMLNAPVVASWGQHSSSSSSSSPSYSLAGTTATGTIRNIRTTNNNNGPEREPDTRGVLAAAAEMDRLPGNPALTSSSSPVSKSLGPLGSGVGEEKFSEFSFVSPEASLERRPGSGNQQAAAAAAAAVAGNSGGSMRRGNSPDSDFHPSPESSVRRRELQSVPKYDIPQLVQVASTTGVTEAFEVQQRDFDKKLFAVKQRMMADKKEAVTKERNLLDFKIKSLKRDVEERDREIEELKKHLAVANRR